MKKIQKKTVLRQNKENNIEIQNPQEEQVEYNINNDNSQITNKQNFSINISTPDIQIETNINNNNNININTENQTQNENNKNKSNEGYLDSDFEDSDNKLIYINIVKRIEENSIPIMSYKIQGNSEAKTPKLNITYNYKPVISNNNPILTNNQINQAYNYNNPSKQNVYLNSDRPLYNNNRYLNNEVNKNNNTSRIIYNIHKDSTKDYKKGKDKLRRKTVDRGGKYNNIQIRHIIDSKKNIEFHIVENLEISKDYSKYKVRNKRGINKNNSTGNFKVTHKSSCDGLDIKHNVKKPNPPKTVIYYHCSEINQKNLGRNKNINKKNNLNQIYQTRSATKTSSIPKIKYNINA